VIYGAVAVLRMMISGYCATLKIREPTRDCEAVAGCEGSCEAGELSNDLDCPGASRRDADETPLPKRECRLIFLMAAF
jgi:hypothetical protein